jgi:hypothetical protein
MIAILAVVWLAGGWFTMGFMEKDPDSFLEFVFIMLLWPLFLGRELKERLDKWERRF